MFNKVLAYAGTYRKKAYLSVLALIASTAVNILPYVFIYQIIMVLLGKWTISPAGLIARVAAIGVCGVLYAFIYMKGMNLSHECAYHTLENIRMILQSKLEKQPLGEIQRKGAGALKKMFTDDVESIEVLLAHSLPEGIANIIVPVFVFIAMFFFDWKLALLSLLSLPLGLLSVGAMSRAGGSRMGAYYAAEQKMNNTIVEYVNGMEVVKVFGKDGDAYRRLEKDVLSYRDLTLDWFKACRPWTALYGTVLPCFTLFTLPVGSFFVLQGYSSLPNFILVLCLSVGIGVPLLRAIGFIPSIPQINHKIAALETTLHAPVLQQAEKDFVGTSHDIVFENVRFSYGETEVLHGVSLAVNQGSVLALVGESGSGKSTLAKLLVHFYDMDGGEIRIGGQDVREMSIEALNHEIAYVSQEQFLFNTSLLENIRLGKPDATDEEVMAAAEKAQCLDFIESMPLGIHSIAGAAGKQLSGGERQRISLARALLKDAPIIVLDEATAFMDPENEDKMNRAIAAIIRKKTVIIIAHRLQSIFHADQICVMKNGAVADTGTHQQLLGRCMEYQTLWKASEQSAGWKITAGKGAQK